MPGQRFFDSAASSSPSSSSRAARPFLPVLLAALALGAAGCEGCAGIQDITPTGSGGGTAGSGGGGTGGAGGGGAGGGGAGGGGAGGGGPTCVPDAVVPAVDCSEVLSGEDALRIAPSLVGDYTCAHLGFFSEVGVPFPSGGMAFSPDDPSTLLVVGNGTYEEATLHTLSVLRDEHCHIAAITGGEKVADVGYGKGVTFGPGGALFFTRAQFASSEEDVVTGLARMEAGDSVPGEVVDLKELGITRPASGIGFLPDGFPGAGGLVITTMPLGADIDPGAWYSVELGGGAGAGPLEVLGVTQRATLGVPSSIAFVRGGSPGFPKDTVLVAEYTAGTIVGYDLDATGAPVTSKGTVLLTVPPNAGPNDTDVGPSAMAIDPVTGDLLVVIYEYHMVVAVQGFSLPRAR